MFYKLAWAWAWIMCMNGTAQRRSSKIVNSCANPGSGLENDEPAKTVSRATQVTAYDDRA